MRCYRWEKAMITPEWLRALLYNVRSHRRFLLRKNASLMNLFGLVVIA